MTREEGGEGQERRWFNRKNPELNLPPTATTLATFAEQVANLAEQNAVSRIWTETFITPEQGEVEAHMMKLADQPDQGDRGVINVAQTDLDGSTLTYSFDIAEDAREQATDTANWDWEMMLISLRELGLISPETIGRDEVVNSLKTHLLGEGRCVIAGRVGTTVFNHELPMGDLPEVFVMAQEASTSDLAATYRICYQVKATDGVFTATSWKEQVNTDWYERQQKRIQDEEAGLLDTTEATMREALALLSPFVKNLKKRR